MRSRADSSGWCLGWGRAARHMAAAALVGLLATACNYPFEPFQENTEGPFSLFGYLDLRADTQWVRVMPVRRGVLPGPEPLDAVVTLQRVGGGAPVTLHDSVFAFTDPRLGSTAWVHNFWTDAPLEPGASYRLRASRADGAATEALVELPPILEFTLLNSGGPNGLLTIRADHLLFVDVIHTMVTWRGEPTGGIAVRQRDVFPGEEAGTYRVFLEADSLQRPELQDVRREEIAIAVASAGWPYDPELSDLDVMLPGRVPTNVENGVGYVGGVATWTIPFHHCQAFAADPDATLACTVRYDHQSASLEGRVVRQPCGDPQALALVRLTERFPDGSSFVRSWKTGWDGHYRFEGVTPGAELLLDLGPGREALRLPPLDAAGRREVEDVAGTAGC